MTPLHIRLKRNGPYWQALWRASDGTQKSKGLGRDLTEKQARAMAAALHAQMIVTPAVRDMGKPGTLAEFLGRRLGLETHLNPRTRSLHRKTAEYMEKFFGADTKLDAVTKPLASDWPAWLSDHGLSQTTISNHVRTARSLFAKGVEEGTVAVNPFSHLNGSAPPPDRLWRELTIPEITRLLDAAPSLSWKALLALCAWAGLRRGEALRMAWDDVLWERNRLLVRNPEGHATTKKRSREVLMEPALAKILLDAREASEGHLVVGLPSAEIAGLHRRVGRIIRAAGMEVWPHPFHLLRRWRATTWREVYPESTVDFWLGHSMLVARRNYVRPPESAYLSADAMLAARTKKPEAADPSRA